MNGFSINSDTSNFRVIWSSAIASVCVRLFDCNRTRSIIGGVVSMLTDDRSLVLVCVVPWLPALSLNATLNVAWFSGVFWSTRVLISHSVPWSEISFISGLLFPASVTWESSMGSSDASLRVRLSPSLAWSSFGLFETKWTDTRLGLIVSKLKRLPSVVLSTSTPEFPAMSTYFKLK